MSFLILFCVSKVDAVMLSQWLQILGEAKQYHTVEGLISNLLHQEWLGVSLDARQLAVALRAFVDAKDVERGKRIFELSISKNPEFRDDPFVINAMLMLYGACHFEDAKVLFDRAVKAKKVSDNLSISAIPLISRFILRWML